MKTSLLLRENAPRRSKVPGIFTSGTTAALIREYFPSQKGVVVSETAPVAENLFNMSLDEPTEVAILTPAVSLVVGDPVEDQERLDPVEPVPDVEPKREKTPVASGSRCLRSSAPGQVQRKPTKKRRILETGVDTLRQFTFGQFTFGQFYIWSINTFRQL